MARKKAEPIEIIDSELVTVIAKQRFNWKFDVMYRFETGCQYTIPIELYNQIKDKVEADRIDKVKLINEINDVNEENK